jgi:hypothetical protein
VRGAELDCDDGPGRLEDGRFVEDGRGGGVVVGPSIGSIESLGGREGGERGIDEPEAA